jgi:hypothetical protein
MADAKIQIKLGHIEFSGEGEQEWVAKQLDKIIAKADSLVKLAPASSSEGRGTEGDKPMGADPKISSKTLPAFLSEKGAVRNQVRKFLATAVWLQAKGAKRITTGDVTKALKDSNQSRLGNPADTLNKNVAKGFCEKEGRQFFVTQEGMNSL